MPAVNTAAATRNAELPIYVTRVLPDDVTPIDRRMLTEVYVGGMQRAFPKLNGEFSRAVGSLSAERAIMGAAVQSHESILMVAKTMDAEPVGFAVARPIDASNVFSLVAIGVIEAAREKLVGTGLFAGVVSEIEVIAQKTGIDQVLQVRTPVTSPAYDFFKAQGGEEQIAEERDSYEFGTQVYIPVAGILTPETTPFQFVPGAGNKMPAAVGEAKGMQLNLAKVTVAEFWHKIPAHP